MIIKMRVEDSGWKFLDGLKDVSYRQGDTGSFPEINVDGFDEVHYGRSKNLGFPTSVLINARRVSDGKEICIESNIDVFLLNDGGKTIERLN